MSQITREHSFLCSANPANRKEPPSPLKGHLLGVASHASNKLMESSTMASEERLDVILSKHYDPTNESPRKFRESYEQLLKHRNELRAKFKGKARRRAKHEAEQRKRDSISDPSKPDTAVASAPAPQAQGSRFSSLTNNDDGSRRRRRSPPTKHTYAPNLKAAKKIDEIPIEQRRTKVEEIKSDIQFLRAETKKRRAAVPIQKAGVEPDEDSDESEEENREEETEQTHVEEIGTEPEPGDDWTTVNRSLRR